MLPFFTLPSIHLFGPVSLHPFGLIFVLGIVLSYRLMMKRAVTLGIAPDEMQSALIWTFAFGLIGAHMLEIIFYRAESIRGEGLLALVNVFNGLSSIGAILGGLLGLAILLKRRRTRVFPLLAIVVEGFLAWWAFVRLGCTLAHDHPGQRSSFFLAFNYPTGPRHNLGFYEFLIVILVLWPASVCLRRLKVSPQIYVASVFATYGALRFGLDFLRATDLANADPRYWGLTAAQYGCLALFMAGSYMLLSGSGLIEIRNSTSRFPERQAQLN